jgi:hypothetical protein
MALLLEGSGETAAEVITRHGISTNELLVFQADPVFRIKIKGYREEIKTKGMTFKLKARAQAEELLTTSWLLIHDPSVAPSVKADLIKSTVKWAGLEPKSEPEINTGNGVSITINLGPTNDKSSAVTMTAVHNDEIEDADYIEYEGDDDGD